MNDKKKTIDSRMYVDVRVVGEGLAVCLGFDKGPDGEQIQSIGMRLWSSDDVFQFSQSLGEVLFKIMQVADVSSFDKIQGLRVRVVVEQENIPTELISATDDRIRWRML